MGIITLLLIGLIIGIIITLSINRYYPKKLPYIKRKYVYLLATILAMLLIIIAFWPCSQEITNNETISYSILNFEISQFAVFAAFFVGILAFIASIYNTNKNYKSVKLSSIPEKSLNLMIDLEFLFNEYEIYSKRNEEDEFILLIEILKYWKNHQKAFLILTPNFYKEFVKIISNPEIINNNDEIYEKNAKYIINAILTYITNVALENENDKFYFIKPESINDITIIKYIGEGEWFYTEIGFNKDALNKYINEFKGSKTKKCTERKFKVLNEKINRLLSNLKSELEEY